MSSLEGDTDPNMETSNNGEDKANVNEDAASPDMSSRKRKNRSKSVIDSGGGGEWLLVSPCNRIPYNKSVSAPDISPDEDRCSITSGSAATFPPELIKRISDTVDAHVNIIADDDDDLAARRSSTPVALMPVAKDADCYNMTHKNRGKCVIFNQEEFDMDFERRDGSTTDADRLSQSFGRLGFVVEVHKNFTHEEIMETLKKLSDLDHTENDCICVIVLTHGLRNDLICARDVAYKSDKIWIPFTADKCTTLAGKPKLFFFQACRGEEIDSGVILSPRSVISATDGATDSESYKIPTQADFLTAHSSAQNFYTWRNPEEGTWYIQCLCDVLDEYGTKTDLLTILTITARKVATDYASNDPRDKTRHDKKQVPSVTSLLLRSVYFPPKTNDKSDIQ